MEFSKLSVSVNYTIMLCIVLFERGEGARKRERERERERQRERETERETERERQRQRQRERERFSNFFSCVINNFSTCLSTSLIPKLCRLNHASPPPPILLCYNVLVGNSVQKSSPNEKVILSRLN